MTCRVLGVRRQGYYEFVAGVQSARAQENELLLKHIEDIHEESRGTYGWPRIHAELTLGLGLAVNHKRVARLMREAGIQGLYRRRRHGCTVRDPDADPYPDLVDRRFDVEGPDRLWVTDITEHPTREGKVYCAVVLDSFSRRVVGWSIDASQTSALVTNALSMAIANRQPAATVIHSDHGVQIYVVGLHRTRPRVRAGALDRHHRRLLRQRHDGVVLGPNADGAAEPQEVEDPHRAGQRDLRLPRNLPQP